MDFDWSMLFFAVIFLIMIAGWLCMAKLVIKHMKRRKKDDASPFIVVEATLVEKRKVRRTRRRNANYATFEFENGDRQEFIINLPDWLAFEEGFVGRLSFQGTRYKGFESIK